MKLLTFLDHDTHRLGALTPDGRILDLTAVWDDSNAPHCVTHLILLGEPGLARARQLVQTHGTDDAHTRAAADTRLAAPLPQPVRNIFCVGRNYREHIIEGNLARGRDPHDFPTALELFTKATTTVVGPDAPVLLHADLTDQLDYEVELAIVIGRGGRDIARSQALEHVFGYTVLNDVTARDLQTRHGQWFKGKSLDTSCPIGPVVTTRDDIPNPNAITLSLSVNGEPRQHASTSSLLFNIEHIIESVSAGLTLVPGDIIATGTPSGVGLGLNPQRFLKAGDVMVAHVEGIGELRNTIVAS